MISKVFNRYLLTVVISFGLHHAAFTKTKDHSYIRDGLSFSVSEGWKTVANDSIGENAYYFSAERTGDQATGLITVTWLNQVEDTEKMIQIHQQSMKSANVYRNPGIEFTTVENDIFAGLKGKSCHYITFVKGQKLEGFICCLNSSLKTITIFFQTGLKDHKLNQKAFDLLKQTFNCRE